MKLPDDMKLVDKLRWEKSELLDCLEWAFEYVPFEKKLSEHDEEDSIMYDRIEELLKQ